MAPALALFISCLILALTTVSAPLTPAQIVTIIGRPTSGPGSLSKEQVVLAANMRADCMDKHGPLIARFDAFKYEKDSKEHFEAQSQLQEKVDDFIGTIHHYARVEAPIDGRNKKYNEALKNFAEAACVAHAKMTPKNAAEALSFWCDRLVFGAFSEWMMPQDPTSKILLEAA